MKKYIRQAIMAAGFLAATGNELLAAGGERFLPAWFSVAVAFLAGVAKITPQLLDESK